MEQKEFDVDRQGNAEEDFPAKRILALGIWRKSEDRKARILELQAWSFECCNEKELLEFEAVHRVMNDDTHHALRSRRVAGQTDFHLILITARDQSEARSISREAPIAFAALSHWGAGPIQGHKSSHELAHASDIMVDLAAIDSAVGSFAESLALSEASEPGLSSPRARL